MANDWTGQTIVLDTQVTDSAYDATHDGVQYHTGRMKIQSIRINGGTNGQAFTLRECSKTNVTTGRIFFTATIETGDLRKQMTFPEGIWVNGISPTALPGGTVNIDLC